MKKNILSLILLLTAGCVSVNPWAVKFDNYADPSKEVCQGYGNVNTWWVDIDGLTKNLAEQNIGICHIEMAAWPHGALDVSKLKENYLKLLSATRARKELLFVSVINDNMWQSKYGNIPPSQAQYTVLCNALIDALKAGGNEGVIIQPVAEMQTSAGKAFDVRCRTELAGFKFVYNGGSRPTGAPAGFSFFAFHPNSMSQAIPMTALNVSDTGGILRELQNGDVYGIANPAVLENYARSQRLKNTTFIYYGFGHKSPDVNAIKALKNSQK